MINDIQRRNLKYQDNPLEILPEKLGDRYYAQDGVRDLNYIIDFALRAAHTHFPDGDLGTPFIISQGAALSSPADDLIDAPSLIGFADYDVEVPLSFAAFPPTKETLTRMALIISVATANIDLTTTGVITPNLEVNPNNDGATTNYVKVQYLEIDGETRARAKSVGSWAYQVADSYHITIDDVAPTAKDILLGTFIYTGGGVVTITTEARSNQKTIQQQWTQTAVTSVMQWVAPSDQPNPGTAIEVTHGDGTTVAENKLDVKNKQIKNLLSPFDPGDAVDFLTFNAAMVFSQATVFTSSGVFNVPANVSKVYVIVIGGGGGGGSSTPGGPAGGGGGAERREGFITVTPGGSETVTVGAIGGSNVGGASGTAGGSSIFSTIISAPGSGGQGSNVGGGSTRRDSTGSGGQIIYGQDEGHPGTILGNPQADQRGGNGGGPAGGGGADGSGVRGVEPGGIGSGGGGAGGAINTSGGAGGGGIVIIYSGS